MNAPKISHTVELPKPLTAHLKEAPAILKHWRGHLIRAEQQPLAAQGNNYHAGDTDNGAGQRFKNQPDDHPDKDSEVVPGRTAAGLRGPGRTITARQR